jgi:hypothetical protein
MEAAGHLSHLFEHRLEGSLGFLETRARRAFGLRNRRADTLKVETERDNPLLRPIVQVALEPPPRLVAAATMRAREAISSPRAAAFEPG